MIISEIEKSGPGNELQSVVGLHYSTGKKVIISFSQGAISGITEFPDDKNDTDLPYIALGLIDNQVNGYCGVDFSGEDLTTDGVKKAARAMFADGVTTFIPVVVTGSHDSMIRSFRVLSEALEDDHLRNSIPGFHLEGPWLSPEPGFYGCHPVRYLRKPSVAEFADYQEAAGGKIIELTLAPELDGAMEVIRYCTENGVKVALGHTNAPAAIINDAVRNVASISTHLGNGCANTIDRHRNPLWPQLANDKLTPSLIADGHHLLPEELIVFCKAKGFENIIITSDVNFLIGMQPGVYNYMGSKIEMSPDGLVRVPELNCLAGASMPLKKGIEIMLRDTGCTMGQAVDLATRNVARVMGLHDRGSLENEKKADMVLFYIADGKLKISQTIENGELAFKL
jgi:N-acetylglucosamine-6-phosphate deacetylase